MSDLCLIQLAKKSEKFYKKAKLDNFLWPWPDLKKFTDKIFLCI